MNAEGDKDNSKYILTQEDPSMLKFMVGAVLQQPFDRTSENEVNELLLNLNQQLMRHSRYKDKLISLIAHDLRTPVLNIDMSLKLLLRRIDDLTKEEISARIAKTLTSCESTVNLLERLLEWSRSQLELYQFRPESLNLLQQIDAVLFSVQPQLELKPIVFQIEIDADLKVYADREMLQIILRNLVSNAIKFSMEDASIIIAAQRIANRIHIRIQDFGVGINPHHLEELKQGNLEHITSFGTNGEKGSGIGINIAKEFIERHQGQLEIESEEEKGSTFSFSIPTAE